MTDTYFGTKLLNAWPMNRQEYVDYRTWELPAGENPDDLGYLVEYLDGGAANDDRHNGYISWSPKDVFDAAYQPTEAMSFSHALTALKAGRKVARAGWNGKGMWLILVGGTPEIEVHPLTVYHSAGLETVSIDPHIDMFTAQGTMQPGWLASQADMLADDWKIVD